MWKGESVQDSFYFNVAGLNHRFAKKYFLQNYAYINLDLPLYFNFTNLLKNVNSVISRKKGFDVLKYQPHRCEDVNHRIFFSKGRKYAIRPQEIINPVIYISLVNLITEEENWQQIQDRFEKLKNEQIECCSIPVIKETKDKKLKAEQIFTWWKHFEQQSIQLSQQYSVVAHTDITNFYGSIDADTIAWALYGKEKAIENKDNEELFGNRLSRLLKSMRYGQTTGIPQGNVFSDFIAEILLAYIDHELFKELEEDNVKNFKILRYRDDYRIFANDEKVCDRIINKLLSKLTEFNLMLNLKKTQITHDVILSSVKPEKIRLWELMKNYPNLQKEILVMYKFSKEYPNSGALQTWLTDLYKKVRDGEGLGENENIETILTLIFKLMLENQSTAPHCCAIISLIWQDLSRKEKREWINRIKKEIENMPSKGILEVWLQRLSITVDKRIKFDSPLCKCVQNNEIKLWNLDWLEDKDIKQTVLNSPIIDHELISKPTPIIEEKEFSTFYYEK